MSTIDHEGFSLSDWVVDEALNEDGFTLDLNSLSPSLASSGKPSPSRSLSTSPRSMPVATATEPHSYGFAIPRWTASTSTSGSEMHSHNTSASSLTRLSASSWPSPSTSAGCSGLTPPPGGAMLPSGASESPASYSQWRTHPSSASAQQLERVGACSSAEPRPFVTKLLAILSENNFAIKWDRRGRAFVFRHRDPALLDALERMYGHRNISSFVRQLNAYGFQRLSTSELLGAVFELDPSCPAHDWSGFRHASFTRTASLDLLATVVPHKLDSSARRERQRVRKRGS